MFKVGDKVIAIENTSYVTFPNLEIGKMYTVLGSNANGKTIQIDIQPIYGYPLDDIGQTFSSERFISAENQLFHEQLERLIK